MTGKEIFEHFGSYFLLDRIGLGGMAEIFRARPADPGANGRIVALKRILPQVAGDPEFLEMFRSEIQVSMAFQHPNTVQIYDFGSVGEQPYLAMEYVQGKNLRQLARAYQDAGRPMPIEIAVDIIEKTAKGLHYVHTFQNKATGQKLDLVHRDVSPQNILISFEGEVKVIDFGIAKAKLRGSGDLTRPGTIKGKLSYLSPEQVTGETLTPASDIFSLGVVLWELLTGQKLFCGNSQQSELATLKILESFDSLKPVSEINPDVPPVLNRIVMMALRKNPSERYKSAQDFAKVLHAFLQSYNRDRTGSRLAAEMKGLFAEEIAQDAERLKSMNERSQELLASPPQGETRIVTRQDSEEPTSRTRRARKPRRAGFAGIKKISFVYGSLYAGIVLLLGGGWWLDSKYLVTQKLSLSSAQVHQAMAEPPKPVVIVQKVVEQAPVTIVEKPVFIEKKSAEKRPVKVRYSALAQPKPVQLNLKILPKSGSETQVWINHKILGKKDRAPTVCVDTPFRVRVERKGYRPFEQEMTVSSQRVGSAKSVGVDVKLKKR